MLCCHGGDRIEMGGGLSARYVDNRSSWCILYMPVS